VILRRKTGTVRGVWNTSKPPLLVGKCDAAFAEVWKVAATETGLL
jgi:hypothetical protein